jgi:tetratricopeptide (TPR) repeat protein/TolB-like protein
MDTLDEASHRLLMECLARAGRQAEALRQADICTRILREELDVAPDAETLALASRIQAGDWPAWIATNDAPPEIPAPPVAALVEPPPPRRSRYPLAWAVAVLVVVTGSASVFALRQSAPPTAPVPAPGLVISDFRSVVGIEASNAVAGLTDLIRLDMATQHHVRLIADPPGDSTQAAPARDRARRDAGGRYLLDGSVALERTMVRVTARVTDVRDGDELWSSHYDKPRIDIQQVADDIATHAARAVSQDRDVEVQSPAAPFHDAPAAARHLIALSYEMDYYTVGPNPPSRQIYRLALQLDNNNVEVLAHLANSYIREAISHYPVDQAALTEADSILRRALPLDPTNISALFNTCLLRRVQRRVPEAMELCRRVLDVDPHYPGALRELGHDLLMSGDAAQAIVSYQASLAAAPFLPYAYNAFKGLGVASLVLGRQDDAIGYFQKAIDADKANGDDEQLWMALVLETGGRHAEADEHLTEFLDRYPRLEVDADYLGLLSAPAFAGRLNQMLAAYAKISARIGPRPSPPAAADAK